MEIKVVENTKTINSDILVVSMFEGEKTSQELINTYAVEKDGFEGKLGQTYLIHTLGNLPADKVLVVGLGNRTDFDHNKMCEAVFYFQSYFGVIHRDLKPENILMTSSGDDGDIRILDFGLSKISTPNEKCTEPYGTLTYCAPEIILDEPYNKEVDMWSLGIMTYLMISGRLPFNGEDENKIARQIAFGEPDFVNGDFWKKISKECINFIKRLLEKDPKKRMLIGDALKHEWFKKFIKKK